VGELGDLLRQSRVQLGLTLEDIQASTHIQRRYLEALEQERFDNVPDRVVGRGFLRSYAAALKLDPNFVVDLYDGVTQPALVAPDSQVVSEKGILYKDIPMTSSSRVPADLIVGLLVVLVLVGGILGAFYIFRDRWLPLAREMAEEPPMPTEDVAFILPTSTPLPTYTPTPTNTPTPLYYTGVTVELRVTEESWAQVYVDGTKDYEGTLVPGDAKNWTGERQVAVRVGNAGGVEIIVNGKSMGVMGQRGQVVDQVWEKVEDGAAALSTPTATPTTSQ
jgi:cytoskeletal protein RodZ